MSTIEKLLAIFLTFELLFVGFLAGSIIYYEDQTNVVIDISAPENYNSRLTAVLSKTIDSPLTLVYGEGELQISSQQIREWIDPYHRDFTKRTELRINTPSVVEYLESIAPGINSQPTNGRFAMESGELQAIVQSTSGGVMDIDESSRVLSKALANNEIIVELVINEIEPEISLVKLEQLGITTLLSRGESNFSGSIASRVTNIEIGASKFNGLIVKPEEEFSFNSHLGNITAANGWKPGYVIKGDKLVPEYGGGICQVSTTMFRSAIEAGLPIVERRSHSLPVRYYDPQGYDATIYTGVVDLRFTNNTPSYILIQSIVEGSNIAIEIYGLDDGREVSVTLPQVYNSSPDGSFKTVFKRTVETTNGEVDEDSFFSSYRAASLFEVVRNPLE